MRAPRSLARLRDTVKPVLAMTIVPEGYCLKKTIARWCLIFGLYAGLVLIGNHLVVQQRQQHEMENLRRQEEDAITYLQRITVERFATGVSDILFLMELPELEDYIRTQDPVQLRQMERDLIGMIKLRTAYDKIRIIDAKGMEVMRINSNDGFPEAVPSQKLQDKSERPYFKVTRKMKPGEIYISSFTYNEEYGKVEEPFKPTFRLVAPFFNKRKELVGCIVINYLGTSLLDELAAKESDYFQIWLLDDDGGWLKEPGKRFQSDQLYSGKLLKPLGELGVLINKKDHGQLMTPNGLFNWKRFNPLQFALSAHKSLESRLKQYTEGDEECWTIMTQVSIEKLRQLERFSSLSSTLILIILLAPGAIGSWFLSQAIVLKHESDRKSHEAREVLEQVTDSIPGAVYRLKLDSDGTGQFLFLSRGAANIFGFEEQAFQIRYDQIVELIIPSDKPDYDRSIVEVFRTGAAWDYEFRIYDNNACLRWIRASALLNRLGPASVLLSGIFTDITSLKIAETRRHSSEERLDLALRAANDGLWDWNVAEGTTYFSPRWMNMLGYEPNELPHHFNTWKSLIHPDDIKSTMQAMTDNIENKIDHYEIEFRLRTKDGRWKWVLSRGAVVQRDPLGRPDRLVGTHTDISDRKELEKNLKAAKDSAEQANKAKSSFLAIMSHELRTPMNSVCGFADSLKHTELEPQQQDYVDKIEKSAGKLLFIINDILDYSKIEAGRLKIETIAFDFVHCVREAVELMRPQLEAKRLKLNFQVEGPATLPVKSDPTRVHQVTVNLLANAIKFTEKGEIVVKIVSREVEGNRLEIETSVRDSGIGMSVEQQAALFQAFSQVDNSTTRKFGGTGLGLAICKRLCELMNGHIWVVSQSQQGSTFSFSLKLDRASESASRRYSDVTEPLVTVKPRADSNRSRSAIEKFAWKVLLIDPDDISRRVATELLGEIGCEVRCMDRGATISREQLTGCTVALVDQAGIEDGLVERITNEAGQLGLHPFYLFGLTDNPTTAKPCPESLCGWISKPVDIRSLSRAFTKAVSDSSAETLST